LNHSYGNRKYTKKWKDTSVNELRNTQAYSPPGRLDWPTGVERLPNGHTLITDAGYWSGQGSEILEVDLLGNIVWRYEGELRFAHTAKLLSNGNILVVDTSNNRLIEVNRNGQLVFSSEDWSGGSGILSDGSKLSYPNNVQITPSGSFVITDRNNNRVVEADRNGRIIKQFENLKHPHNGEILPDGNLLFANSDANLVQEIDSSGRIVWSFRNFYRPEPIPGELKNPDFEKEAFSGANSPADWYTCDLVSEGGANFFWDSQSSHTGNRCIGVEYSNPGAVWWQQIVQVSPENDYRMSGYIKSDELDGFCQIQLSFLDEEGCSLHTLRELPGGKQFQGTNDWVEDIFVCRSHPKATAVEIRLMVAGKGKVWFDDVYLEKVATEEIKRDVETEEKSDAKEEEEEIKKRLEKLGYLG